MKLNYLESADSTRIEYDSIGVDDAFALDARYKEIQLFLEMVTVLAMGRTVVVPQTFAFDSYAFLQAAHRVWAAWEMANKKGPAPIFLHLYGAGSFDGAVSSMLARGRDPKQGFHFSSYPELNDGRWKVDPDLGPAGVLRRLQDGDPRKAPLEAAVNALKHAGPNPDARPAPKESLELLLSRSIEANKSQLNPELAERLSEASLRLGLADAVGNARSHLRRPGPWPGRDVSARELVDDKVAFDLLVEGMDTLYNRVVAHTCGARYQSFTTELGTPGGLLIDLAKVQGSVVESFGDGAVEDGTALDVRVESSEPLANSELERFWGLVAADDRLVSGLVPLMQARADGNSEFSQGVSRLNRAAPGRGRARALADHVELVADLIGGSFRVNKSESRWFGVSTGLSLAGAGAAVAFSPQLDSPATWVTASIAVGAAVASAVPTVRGEIKQRRNSVFLRRALGSVLKESDQ